MGEGGRAALVAYAEVLVEDASEALFALSIDGSVLRWNRAAGELFGASRAAVEGRAFASFLGDEEGGAVAARVESALAEAVGRGRARLAVRARAAAVVDVHVELRAV